MGYREGDGDVYVDEVPTKIMVYESMCASRENMVRMLISIHIDR